MAKQHEPGMTGTNDKAVAGSCWEHLSREDQHTVRGKHEVGGIVEAVQRVRQRGDSPAIARSAGIEPILIGITVEYFTPIAAAGEADPVADTGGVGQVQDHQYIEAFTFNPAVKGQDTVLIVHMHHTKPFSSQTRTPSPDRQQFSDEAQMVEHLLVALVQAGPIEQQISVGHENRRTTVCPPRTPAP